MLTAERSSMVGSSNFSFNNTPEPCSQPARCLVSCRSGQGMELACRPGRLECNNIYLIVELACTPERLRLYSGMRRFPTEKHSLHVSPCAPLGATVCGRRKAPLSHAGRAGVRHRRVRARGEPGEGARHLLGLPAERRPVHAGSRSGPVVTCRGPLLRAVPRRYPGAARPGARPQRRAGGEPRGQAL